MKITQELNIIYLIKLIIKKINKKNMQLFCNYIFLINKIIININNIIIYQRSLYLSF